MFRQNIAITLQKTRNPPVTQPADSQRFTDMRFPVSGESYIYISLTINILGVRFRMSGNIYTFAD